MPNLLTAKEVQELLSVDRTTIYRMLKDGRLEGVKVGNQWRFSDEKVKEMLGGSIDEDIDISASNLQEALPIHCMQPIQDVFAEIAEVGSVVTDKDGNPITRISNSCDFCKLILGSAEGRQGCFSSWKELAEAEGTDTEFRHCHAGLEYARAKIEVKGELVASLVSGQFYTAPPDAEEERKRVEKLAKKCQINPSLLLQAAQEIHLFESSKPKDLEKWLARVADTFVDISTERADMMLRLQTISEVSAL